MLKNIPNIISPELLKILSEMYFYQLIRIADGNFPAESIGKECKVIRMDGHNIPEVLDAILRLFPLDSYVAHPVSLMEVMKGDNVKTPIWDEYRLIVKEYDTRGENAFENIERFSFYEKSKKAYAIIATGEKALYANIILQKGVI